jgi:acetyltransferase-like isoleucine patch superfamily enzyme
MIIAELKYFIKAPVAGFRNFMIRLSFVLRLRSKGSYAPLSVNINNKLNLLTGTNCRIGMSVTLKNYREGSITTGDNCSFEDFSVIESLKGNISFGNDSTLNQFSIIRAWGDVRIGSGVRIGPSVHIMAMKHNFDDPDKFIFEQGISGKGISIGDNVWIGGNVCILDDVNIGRNCIIGAGSVVTKDIPDNSIAVGNPCRVIKELKTYIQGGQNERRSDRF